MGKTLDQKLPENLFKKEQDEFAKEQERKKKAEEDKKKVQGVLRVVIVEAMGLIKVDKFSDSDPMAIVRLSQGSKQTLKSKEIVDCNDPKWNFSDKFTVDYAVDPNVKQSTKIMITVEDYNMFPESNTFLGYAEIDLSALKIEEEGQQNEEW